ncbi:Diguanylate cyclase [Alteromonas sp. 38]|uniref:GGDEF domain-containing protein n=1 Tax=unclassified Alteromonas TaxID=2614992 RepID=UPI0012EFF9D7|nr:MULTISPECIES: diguanylate cyclase [unclassified Alteromonas]CAD5260084.1 Diguanylate cyclase [Alteromonas sp. 154]VXC33232.1 Diguanylate cyclase [Alteromonas sp. 38]
MLYFFLATCIIVSIAICAALCGYFTIKTVYQKKTIFRYWSVASGLLCCSLISRLSDTLLSLPSSFFILGLITFVVGFHQVFLGLESLQKHKDYKLNRHALPVLGIGVSGICALWTMPALAESVAMFFCAALVLLSEGVLYNDNRVKEDKRALLRRLLLISSFSLFLHGTVSVVNSITGGMDDLSLLFQLTSMLMVISAALIVLSLMRCSTEPASQSLYTRSLRSSGAVVLTRDDFIQQAIRKLQQTDKHENVILLVEIDGYQDVVDNYGASAGESASYQVGQSLIHFTRSNDIAGQISESKFAIMLSGVTIDSVHVVADRLVKQVFSKNVQTLDSAPMFTASIGIAPSSDIVFSWQQGEPFDEDSIKRQDGTSLVYMLSPLKTASL